MDENELRNALKACLSDSCFSEERQSAVLRSIRQGEKSAVRRKFSAALVFATLLILAIGGAAVAASMGVFGRQSGSEMNEQGQVRLLHLEDAAEIYDETRSSTTASASEQTGEADEEQTLYDMLLARQHDRRFSLTLNQAYCDGYKLYYSYTLTVDSPLLRITGEGAPSGFTRWTETVENMQDHPIWLAANEQEQQLNAAFFAEHPVGYIAQEHMGIGDGAWLDGKPLNIYDSGETYSGDTMIQGFQEVELPEGYARDGEIKIELNVYLNTDILYQDEHSLCRTTLRDEATRGYQRIPFEVKINGEAEVYTGSITTSSYSAAATVRVSDVDISGEVVFDAPEWAETFETNGGDMKGVNMVAGYDLVADGVELPNRDGAFGVNADGRFVVSIRYDLPESLSSLVLVPTSSGLKPSEAGEKEPYEDERIILFK